MYNGLKIGQTIGQKSAPETQETGRRLDPSNPQPSYQEALSSQPSAPPEVLPQDLANSSQEVESQTSHFDSLIDEIEEFEQEQELESASLNMLTRQQFEESFIGLHGMAAAFSGLESIALPNSRVDTGTANEVAGAIYETILDVPMLHFILQPGNKWLGRALVMVVYVQGMRGAVGAELAARRKDAGGKMDYTKAKKSAQKSHDSGELSPEQAAALTGG